jgi:hypothetical protein
MRAIVVTDQVAAEQYYITRKVVCFLKIAKIY